MDLQTVDDANVENAEFAWLPVWMQRGACVGAANPDLATFTVAGDTGALLR